MGAVEISIAIISHGHEEFVERCLASLEKELSSSGVEVFIVDNLGQCGMDGLAARYGSQVQVHRNARQMGFAANCNQAFRMTRGEYVLLLNPDTELVSGHLSEALAYMDANQHVGILGARLVNSDGTPQASCRCFPSVPVFALRLLGADKWNHRPAFYRSSLLEGRVFVGPTRVDLVTGAFFLVRRLCFERIGGFDESFFLYYEDADFCFRARSKGLETHYFPALTLTHHHQRSSKSFLGPHARWHAHSSLHYFLKHRYFIRPVFGEVGPR